MGRLMLLENPFPSYRKLKRRKNVAGLDAKKLMQGVTTMDVIGAAAGLAASNLIPPMIIKPAAGAELTKTQQWLRIGLGAVVTLGLGYAAKSFLKGQGTKGLIIGGLSGVASQALFIATGTKITGSNVRRLGTPVNRVVSYPGPINRTYEPEFKTVGTV